MTGQSTNPERRAERRIPVSLEAVLYYNALMLPECRVRDLSPEGAFVITGGHFLPDRALLDLAFGISAAGGVPQRVIAQVMRCTDEGVGVRLQHNDTSFMRNLIETLYAA